MTCVWLEDQLQNPPEDMSEDILTSIKKYVAEGKAETLGEERQVGPFYLYLLGDNYRTVSEKTGWKIELIATTALKFRWYEKKIACTCVNEQDSAKYVLKSAMSAMLVATAHEIQKQTKEVMSGNMNAEDCKYIPKNMKELQSFMMIMSQIYGLNAKNENNQNVTVNIANVGTQQSSITAKEDVKVIEAEKPEADRMSKFKMLREAESK